MNQPHRLPYSIIRYHSDPARHEGVNVGILIQTPQGLSCHLVDDWPLFERAYPFLDATEIEKRLAAVKDLESEKTIRVFDYQRNEGRYLSSGDPALLGFLKREIDQGLELTEPRYAELEGVTSEQVSTLTHYLYETFVEPPKLRHVLAARQVEVQPRPAHSGLRRKAKGAMLKVAKKQLPHEIIQQEPEISGVTRKWKLDLGISANANFLQHILVLPDVEETLHETAAVGRIWQDVKVRHRNAGLTAVFFSQNGIPRGVLRDSEKLLKKDAVETIHINDLPSHLKELRGQLRLTT
jgi:Protein of unknown function (DUF3037)